MNDANFVAAEKLLALLDEGWDKMDEGERRGLARQALRALRRTLSEDASDDDATP